jgi:hypothetical protein
MMVPRLFHGTRWQVTKRLRSSIRRLERTDALSDLAFGELMDTAEDPYAKILLDSGGAHLHDKPNFHMYAFFHEASDAFATDRITDDQFEACFAWSLEEPWRLLGVCGEDGTAFLFTPERSRWSRLFLLAVWRFWHILEGEGPRYGGLLTGPFSMTANAVIPTIAELGASLDSSGLTPARTYELLRMVLNGNDRSH